jgi:hypothetical protein
LTESSWARILKRMGIDDELSSQDKFALDTWEAWFSQDDNRTQELPMEKGILRDLLTKAKKKRLLRKFKLSDGKG